MKSMKYYIVGIELLLLIFSLCSCKRSEIKKTIYFKDTIHLQHYELQYWMNYFHPKLGNVNTFIDGETYEYVIMTSTGVIKFPLKPLINVIKVSSNPVFTYALDSSFSIVAYFDTNYQIYKINRKGELLKIIQLIDKRKNKQYPIHLFWKLMPILESKSTSKQLFICDFVYSFDNFNSY